MLGVEEFEEAIKSEKAPGSLAVFRPLGLLPFGYSSLTTGYNNIGCFWEEEVQW